MSNAIIAIPWVVGQEAPTFPQAVIDANGGKAPGYSVVGAIPKTDRRGTVLVWIDAEPAALTELAKSAGYVESLAAKDRAAVVDAKRAGDVATFLVATAATAKPPAPITKLATVGDLVDIMCKEHGISRERDYEPASATVAEVKPEEPPVDDDKLLLAYGWKWDGKDLWTIEHDGKPVEATMEEAVRLTAEWQAEKPGVDEKPPVVVKARAKRAKVRK